VVDYDSVIPFKQRLLEKAWTNFKAGEREDLRPAYDEFCARHAHWMEDYALFAALKAKYHGAYYLQWPAQVVQRDPNALAEARRELATQIDQVRFAQFLVFRQGDQLKNYAHAKGVSLIGDLPFFVSPDSSDVWANPELFLLDEQRRPRFIAGVPPDYFSAQGQLWGNPVYNWDVHRSTGYRWCIARFQALLAHVDLIRLDHFRGFAAAWHVSAGASTAQSGQWVQGPGAGFFQAVRTELGRLPFIAEDLGLITPTCRLCATNFNSPAPACCNSHSTAMRTIHIFRTTLFPTRSHIPVLMTMPRLANGTKSWPTTSDKICGITSNARRARPRKLLRR
jgi:4-alpha-glucanotransferase